MQKNKTNTSDSISKTRSYPANKPGELATFDIAGPFVPTPHGHIYLIVIRDHFTKFVAIYPLKDMMAEIFAYVLVDYMCKYGLVETVLSDLRTNFMSQLLELVRYSSTQNHFLSTAMRWLVGALYSKPSN